MPAPQRHPPSQRRPCFPYRRAYTRALSAGEADDAAGALTSAPGAVRAHLRNTLAEWNMTAMQEVAELLASELITNAVLASTDEQGQPVYIDGHLPVIVFRLIARPGVLVLEVWDVMPSPPIMRQVDVWDEGVKALQPARPRMAGCGRASRGACHLDLARPGCPPSTSPVKDRTLAQRRGFLSSRNLRCVAVGVCALARASGLEHLRDHAVGRHRRNGAAVPV